jgi:TetR/AcrR family transcriptional regulator, mexJK operon transcriptional repressor
VLSEDLPEVLEARGLPSKRAAIMRAGYAVFVRQSFDGTSLDDIAAEAQVSRQTVYNHFGDKEALFLAVVDEALTTSLDALRGAIEAFPDWGKTVEEQLLTLGRNIATVFMSHTNAEVRLLIQAEAPRHAKMRALWEERARTPVWSSLVGHFARLAHAGELYLDDPAVAAGQFVTLVTGAGWHMTRYGTFTMPGATDAGELERTLLANIALFVRAYGRPA